MDKELVNKREALGFAGLCGFTPVEADAEHAVYTMEITPQALQFYGFLHGGATLALIESAASRAAAERANDDELPFGINMNVTHKKPGIAGMLTATAVLEHEEPSSSGVGRKQFWDVRVIDEEGDTISEGVFLSKIVPTALIEGRYPGLIDSRQI